MDWILVKVVVLLVLVIAFALIVVLTPWWFGMPLRRPGRRRPDDDAETKR